MKHLTYGKCLQMTKKAKIYCKNDDDDPFGFLMNNCREYFVVCELNFIYYFQNVFSLNFFLLLLLCCIILYYFLIIYHLIIIIIIRIVLQVGWLIYRLYSRHFDDHDRPISVNNFKYFIPRLFIHHLKI